MSPESVSTTTDDLFSESALGNKGTESSDTFVWEFNLNEIDPSLIFDESVTVQQTVEDKAAEISNQEAPPTFFEWLNHTVPAEETQSDQLPHAFTWAQTESVKTSERLANVSLGGLNSISGALGSLMSIVGACGPICFHALGSVAPAGSSGLSLAQPGVGGLNLPEFNSDKKGNFKLSGNINSLANATKLSREALLSGKHSAQDILTTFFSIFGEGICHIFGFGLIECLINGLIPTPQSEAA